MIRAGATRVALRRGRRRVLLGVLFAAAAALFVFHWLPTVQRSYDLAQSVQSGGPQPQYDLFQYYAAGHNWRAGLDPYLPLTGVQGAISIPRSTAISGYIYPPTILPLLGELSRLGYDRARAVWLAVSLGMLLLPLGVGAALAVGRRWETIGLGLVVIAASDPVIFHMRQGQIDMIVAGLAITGFLLYGRWRSWPSAFLLAAAITVKLTPLVLLMVLVAYRRDWRLLAKAAVAGGALVAVSLLAVHPHLYWDYVTRVLPEASGGNPFFHNQSLLRAWSHLSAWVKYASLAGYAAVVLVAAAASLNAASSPAASVAGPGDTDRPGAPSAAACRRRPSFMSRDLQVLTFGVLGILLFSPLSWRMAYVWAVAPTALALAAAPWMGSRWQYALLLAGAVLMCLPVWDRPVLDSVETIGAVVAGAGLLAALLAPALRRSRARLEVSA